MFKKIKRCVMMLSLLGLTVLPVIAQDLPEEVTMDPIVVLKTNHGVIKIKLNEKAAPISAENFLKYVHADFYNGTVFHRVIPGFMIQGGGFNQHFEQKETHKPIKNEADNGLKNLRGTVAMARTSIIDSATAQFFINLKDNQFLDYTAPTLHGYGYAVFGEVIEGMDVVDAIAKVQTGHKHGHQDVPIHNVVIETATVETAE